MEEQEKIKKATVKEVLDDARGLKQKKSNRKEAKKKGPEIVQEASWVWPQYQKMAEMVYDPRQGETKFAIFNNGKIYYKKGLSFHKKTLIKYPYPPDDPLLKGGIFSVASEAKDYESEEKLIEEIKNFINKYLDISPTFQNICTYYALFTWIYDRFNEVPYLRALGDYGTGKTRFLIVMGSICYKSLFATGAITPASVFRLIDQYGGTLIIDEADFRWSDSKAEIVKILNSGHIKKPGGVFRCEEIDNNFKLRFFKVFGPKILATREPFEDPALESRCLTEEMGLRKFRNDIPLSLPPEFEQEAETLRNQLLMFRFRNYFKKTQEIQPLNQNLEPRIRQVAIPLLSIISSPEARKEIEEFLNRWNDEMRLDRGMNFEANLLEIVAKIIWSKEDKEPTIQEITDAFNENYEQEYGKKKTARGIGYILRKKLRIKPERTREGYIIPVSEKKTIEILAEKYGIKKEELEKEAFSGLDEIEVVNEETEPNSEG